MLGSPRIKLSPNTACASTDNVADKPAEQEKWGPRALMRAYGRRSRRPLCLGIAYCPSSFSITTGRSVSLWTSESKCVLCLGLPYRFYLTLISSLSSRCWEYGTLYALKPHIPSSDVVGRLDSRLRFSRDLNS